MFQSDADDIAFARHRRTGLPLARHRRDRAVYTWLILAALLLAAVSVFGQPFGTDPEAATVLLEELADDYQVLTLSDRYLLQPTDPDAGFRVIEITAGAIAVDGETVTGDRLRDLVGDAATTLVDISRLGSAEGSAEELRQRIERLSEERRLKAEQLEEQVAELEDLEAERLEAVEESLEDARREQRRDERQRRRRGSVRTDTRVSFGSSLTVEDNETSRDVVVLGGSLDVEGKVRGDALVVGGSAEIRGEVSGTVTAVGGSISLGPGARIEGDAISIGGAVHRDPSADVYGEVTEVALGPGFELDDLWDDMWIPHWHFDWFDFGLGDLFGRISLTVVLAVLLLLLTGLFPRLTTAVGERARREPWKAALVGLLAEVLMVILVAPVLLVVFIILCITIVGIPFAVLLVLFAPLAVAVLFYLGLAGVAQVCGRRLQDRFGWGVTSPYLLLILGVAVIQGWSILGEGLGVLGWPFRLIAWMVLLFGFLVKYIAWTTGLGAMLLHYLSPPLALQRRPAPPVPPAPVPAGPPGVVPPPPPAPTGWEDTAVSTESEAPYPIDESEPEPPDPDREYREAGEGSGVGAREPEEPPGPETVYTDEDYREAGEGSGVGGREPEEPPGPETVYTDQDYREAGDPAAASEAEPESGDAEDSEPGEAESAKGESTKAD